MKFQVGDKVTVLHSDEEGEIIDIINDQMVMVDVRGVKFPAYIDQLDFPYYKRFTEKKLFTTPGGKKFAEDIKKEKAPVHKVVDGVWLSFLPIMDTDEFGDDVVEELKIHLINRTYKSYKFYYHLQFYGNSEFEIKNEIHPFSDFYIHDVPFADMSDSPSFSFEFSLLQPDKTKSDFFETVVKLKPKQLFAKIEETRQKGEATFSFRLFEEFPDRPVEEAPLFSSLKINPYKAYNAKEATKHLPAPRTVIDLHIEKLSAEWKHLTNGEILEMQLKEFEKWYDITLAYHQLHLIIIHGIGSGRLRDEIHDLLRLKKEVKSFVNQYHPSFGYGATEIYLQY